MIETYLSVILLLLTKIAEIFVALVDYLIYCMNTSDLGWFEPNTFDLMKQNKKYVIYCQQMFSVCCPNGAKKKSYPK